MGKWERLLTEQRHPESFALGKAGTALSAADQEIKTAIVMLAAGLNAERARHALAEAGGFVRSAIAHDATP